MFFILDFVKLYLLPQLRHLNTFQHLIQNLPLTYKQCREGNTIKKCQQYFKTWKECAAAHQVCFLPAETMHVALFLLSKIQAGHTFPTIDASFYAIKFFHKSLLNVDPCSQVIFLLLTCSKLQNESQLIEFKRKRQYLWTI